MCHNLGGYHSCSPVAPITNGSKCADFDRMKQECCGVATEERMDWDGRICYVRIVGCIGVRSFSFEFARLEEVRETISTLIDYRLTSRIDNQYNLEYTISNKQMADYSLRYNHPANTIDISITAHSHSTHLLFFPVHTVIPPHYDFKYPPHILRTPIPFHPFHNFRP